VALLRRRFGSREADAVLRATLVAALAALPVIWLVPGSEPFVLLALTTFWFRGPLGMFSFVGLEPVLMLYGRLYPPWLVTAVAATASVYTEIFSLHLVRGVMALRLMDRLQHSVRGSRLMRLFNRRPAIAIAVAAVSPVPDWVTRTLGAVSRYPARRYVTADTIGRLPKFFIPAALGSILVIPAGWLVALAAGAMGVGLAAGVVRMVGMRGQGAGSRTGGAEAGVERRVEG